MISSNETKVTKWERVESARTSQLLMPATATGLLTINESPNASCNCLPQFCMEKKLAVLDKGHLTLSSYKQSRNQNQPVSFDMALAELHQHTSKPKLLIRQNSTAVSVQIKKNDFDHWLQAFTDHLQYGHQQRSKSDNLPSTECTQNMTARENDESLLKDHTAISIAGNSKTQDDITQPRTSSSTEQSVMTTNLSAVDHKFRDARTKLVLLSNRLEEVSAMRHQLKTATFDQNRQRELSLLVQLAIHEMGDAQKVLVDTFDLFRLTLDIARAQDIAEDAELEERGDLDTDQKESQEEETQIFSFSSDIKDDHTDTVVRGVRVGLSGTGNSSKSEFTSSNDHRTDMERRARTVPSESCNSPSIRRRKRLERRSSQEKERKRAKQNKNSKSSSSMSDVRTAHAPGYEQKCRLAPAPSPTIISLKTIFNRRYSLPISLFEPVGMLQIGAEIMRFSHLLDKAARTRDAAVRMAFVMAFSISPFGNTIHRSRKPFNPLLYETYELDRTSDMGWKYISEQVSHNPDISACYVEGRGWTGAQATRYTLHPGLSGIEVRPDLECGGKLVLHQFNETYTALKMPSSIFQNLLRPSERKLVHQGVMEVHCNSGMRGVIVFEKDGKGLERYVHGSVLKGTVQLSRIEGHWAGDIHLIKRGVRYCIFKSPNFSKENLPEYYGFSPFTRMLNELTNDMMGGLPPTDTRFRPDQRFMEEGKFDDAQTVKAQLEENQRERKRRQDKGIDSKREPIWFVPDQKSRGIRKSWSYDGKYWQTKENAFKDVDFCPIWS